MSHNEISEVTAPRSQFYQGPYGRMFRNLPPHVPTPDLLKGKSIRGLSINIAGLLEDFLEETDQKTKDQKLTALNGAIDKLLEDECRDNTLNEMLEVLEGEDRAKKSIIKYLAKKAIRNMEELPEDRPENITEIFKEFQDKPVRDIKSETLDALEIALKDFVKSHNVRLSDTEKTILTELNQALQNTEAGREAILKLLARTMIDKDIEQSKDPTGDNPDIPAGYTYFLQFITHDITFDPTSSLMRFNDPNRIRNFRTPRLDLDSLYGGGPDSSPFMYNYDPYYHPDNPNPCDVGSDDHNPRDPNQRYYLLVGKGKSGREDDLPRNSRGCALIGDPRNDENIMISQLQLAFIKFHNVIMKEVEKELKGETAFHETQRLVRWHYQWVILHDVLPRFVDDDILEDILGTPDHRGKPKLRYYQWHSQPFIPVEFSVAAFRFGHSMIRSQYSLNKHIRKTNILPSKPGSGRLTHLMGFRKLPTSWTIQWDLFLDINNHPKLQKSRHIDIKLSSKLGQLLSPLEGKERRSLAALDLLRGYKFGLPSGQAVAKAMGEKPLKGPEEPLWYYILREAEKKQKEIEKAKGKQRKKEAKHKQGTGKLGPVGGRIIAEVLIGLIASDPHSFLNVEPGWQPTCRAPLGDKFELRDILRHAQVPLTEEEYLEVVRL